MDIALLFVVIVVLALLIAWPVNAWIRRPGARASLTERMREHAGNCDKCKLYGDGESWRLSDHCATGNALRAEQRQAIEQRQSKRLAHDALRTRSAH